MSSRGCLWRQLRNRPLVGVTPSSHCRHISDVGPVAVWQWLYCLEDPGHAGSVTRTAGPIVVEGRAAVARSCIYDEITEASTAGCRKLAGGNNDSAAECSKEYYGCKQ